MAGDFLWKIILQFVILYICTRGDGLTNGHESERSMSTRFKVAAEHEMRKPKNGMLKQENEQVKREKGHHLRPFTIGSNDRRHINIQNRRHPVRNYDFFDQSNDFEWFKQQGRNRYPYHGSMPAYSHEGYHDYEKAPDPYAVSQAMNLLEKHMTSSEALSSDNMFKNNEGERHDGQNGPQRMMNHHENHDGNDNGVYDMKDGDVDNENFQKLPMSQNEGYEGYNGRNEVNDEHGANENTNGNEHGHRNEQRSDQEDSEYNQNNMKQNEDMAEKYHWDSVKGPELQHGNESPKIQDNDGSPEGRLPSGHNEYSHDFSEGNDEHTHGSHVSYNENSHGSQGGYDGNNQKSLASETKLNYYDKEGGNVDEQNKEDHGLNMHSDGRTSNDAQKSKSQEENIDFPKTTNSQSTMQEIGNQNRMKDKAYLADVPTQPQEAVQQHESAERQKQPNQAYEESGRQPRPENQIKINVGFPHYDVPNAHTEPAKIEPHQGPERGGGLWGNLPGVGEQFNREDSDQNNANDKLTTDEKSKLDSKGNSFNAERKKEVANEDRGAFGLKLGKEGNINRNEGEQNNSKGSKMKRIPVTIKTGVYDSREIFTIDRKKEYISSKPLPRNFKRREEKIRKIVNNSARKPRRKRKKSSAYLKHMNKKKERKGFRHALSSTELKSSSSRVPLQERFTRGRKYKKTTIHQLAKSDCDSKVIRRHGAGEDLNAVHGHPAISDEEAMHSNPDELLDIANQYRHRAEEYDSKAKELENQAEIQDHQQDFHGSISHHLSHQQGPERGGNLHGDVHEEQNYHQNRIGPWNGPAWHGPGPFGMSHFNTENGHGGHIGGEHGGQIGGEHGGHNDHMIHFDTGYPYYHVPRQHSLPLIEYHKPVPPVHGLNPYEVLTSEQFHRPMLPAGHGNLPYGHTQRTLQSSSDRTETSYKRIYPSKTDIRNVEPDTVFQLPNYETKDILSDENINSFLLK